MRTSELRFYKKYLQEFCIDRAIFIIKDFNRLFVISNKDSFINNTTNKFNEAVLEFKEQFNKLNVNMFFDSVINLKNLIPSITISIVGDESFMVYDVFTGIFYTYENNSILIKEKQACADMVDTSMQFNGCDSLKICRYLMKFSDSIDIDNNSPFQKFIHKNEEV